MTEKNNHDDKIKMYPTGEVYKNGSYWRRIDRDDVYEWLKTLTPTCRNRYLKLSVEEDRFEERQKAEKGLRQELFEIHQEKQKEESKKIYNKFLEFKKHGSVIALENLASNYYHKIDKGDKFQVVAVFDRCFDEEIQQTDSFVMLQKIENGKVTDQKYRVSYKIYQLFFATCK